MLSGIYSEFLPEVVASTTLHNLVRSFEIEAPAVPSHSPSWDLELVFGGSQE